MKFIHLLYVPTLACNMRCTYCYLGEQTEAREAALPPAADTLAYAVEKLLAAEVVPFNISLHGGEVTTLSPEVFESLTGYIARYYRENALLLKSGGFRVGAPHIKTNLFGLEKHLETIGKYGVSVSGSLDLPLSMHRKHRLSKGGGDTLDTILRNVELLRQLPCRKKVSATIFREHFLHLDEIVRDIRWLHENTCLDMNDFNFMVGFASPDAPGALTPLSPEEQTALFERMEQEFAGTDLEKGLRGAWFAEFGPEYCTNCVNCGEKFFLLERSGDVYSCVRGQGHPEFCYGNIYRDSVETILANGEARIREAHAAFPMEEECTACRWFDLCKTGCPFVKHAHRTGRSYTCALQKLLYRRDHADFEPPENALYHYLFRMNPETASRYWQPPATGPLGMPSLHAIIEGDPTLKQVYDPGAFVLCCDGRELPLESQILKQKRHILTITKESSLTLYMRRDVLSALSRWPAHNTLYVMLLDGRTIVYGDEGRTKQAHVATLELHGYALEMLPSDREGWYRIPLDAMLAPYLQFLGSEQPFNLFFTTAALRNYHYAKQKENAYYHLQAINLPFPNIEFVLLDKEALLQRLGLGANKGREDADHVDNV